MCPEASDVQYYAIQTSCWYFTCNCQTFCSLWQLLEGHVKVIGNIFFVQVCALMLVYVCVWKTPKHAQLFLPLENSFIPDTQLFNINMEVETLLCRKLLVTSALEFEKDYWQCPTPDSTVIRYTCCNHTSLTPHLRT